MGSDEDEGSNEHPMHTVTVTGFYMGRFQVTQELYRAVTGNNPSEFTGDRRPVETVTWFDAVEFCNRLSLLQGFVPVYTITNRVPATGFPITSATVTANWNADGYRLPTEAEWEYAARGGDGSPGNFIFAGSNTAGDVARYFHNSENRTWDVGSLAPNGLGIYDMSGNVEEWCWDWFGSYTVVAKTNPTGPLTGNNRVFRGGSWETRVTSLPSILRDAQRPLTRHNVIGFRIVRRSLPPNP